MGRYADLTGQRFGKLTAVKRVGPVTNKNRGAAWLCLCDCGNECVSYVRYLRDGGRKSCGCAADDCNRKDLSGQRFGKLVATEPTEQRAGNSIVWKCLCDCGNTAFVSQRELTTGNTRSCGCMRSTEKLRKQVYERITGTPIPSNCTVFCLDGNKSNLSAENLVCIENKVLKTLHKRRLISSDPDINRVAIEMVRLRQKIHELEYGTQE